MRSSPPTRPQTEETETLSTEKSRRLTSGQSLVSMASMLLSQAANRTSVPGAVFTVKLYCEPG